MKAWSTIQAGDVIEWEEDLDVNRGTYRAHKITVDWRRGKNIQATNGSLFYWGERGLGANRTVVNADKRK